MGNDDPVIGIRWPGDPVGPDGVRVRHIPRPGPIYEAVLSPPPPIRRPGFSARDLVTLAWHSRAIWLGFLALGVAVGALVALANPRLYTATALLLVLGADDAAMQAELSILRSDDVVNGAVARIGAERMMAAQRRPPLLEAIAPVCPDVPYWSRGLAGCAATLVKAGLEPHIDGQRHGEAAGQVLRLEMTYPDPALAVATLDAVVLANREVRHAAYVTPRAGPLAPQLAMAEAAARETVSETARIRAQAGVLDISGDIAAATAEASALSQRQSKVRERQTAVQAERQKTDEQLRITPQRIIASREVSRSDSNQDTRAVLLQLQLERAHLAELYAPGFKGLVELDRKIAAVKAAAAAAARSSASVTRDIANPAFEALTNKASSLQAEAEALTHQRAELERQATAMVARADALRAADARLADLRQRQEAQDAVVRQLSVEIAALRTQDTLAAARTDDLRVLQRPAVVPTPWTGFGTYGVIGAAAGWLAGIAAAVLAARNRATYVVSREVERHLGIAELAQVRLWARGKPQPAPAADLTELTARVLDATDEEGASVATVHLVGTAEHDGAAMIARALGAELVATRGVRVLMLQLGVDGSWEMQSLGDATSSEVLAGPQPNGLVATPAHAMARITSASGVARALFGERQAVNGPLQIEIAKLRAMHDMVLVVSSHSVAAPVTKRLSALADLDVVVLRAGMSRARSALRLRDCLAGSGGRTLGFVFTTERPIFSLRTA